MLLSQKYFSSKKREKERKNTHGHHRKQEKLWVFLLLVQNLQRKKEKLSLPLNHGRSSLSLSLWVEDKKKGKEKALFLSILPKISVTHSMPWLKLVLLSHPWPKIGKGRRKDASFTFLPLFFGPSKKIKEETAKASPLLANVKGADDKTWGSCRSPLFTTATKILNSHVSPNRNCSHVTRGGRSEERRVGKECW